MRNYIVRYMRYAEIKMFAVGPRPPATAREHEPPDHEIA